MCGIAGIAYHDRSREVSRADLQQMLETMTYRGPDGNGTHVAGNVGLGHLRLSIIDLAAGAQPMSNEDGTVWIVFNGEIYNFQALRSRLLARGHTFSTHSDTEVIVHLYEDLGDECVKELHGMFAFAIWDARQQLLFLARDRIGIKPLYYTNNSTAFLFASELKALLRRDEVARKVNPRSIDTFLNHFFLPGSETMLEGICRLPPGHTLTLRAGRVRIHQYWELSFPVERSSLSLADAAAELRSLLGQCVKDHMIADVPVGFLASGGVDSTAVLSFAVEQTGKQVQTFTIGFSDPEIPDERPFAQLAARRFGARHHEITMSAQQFGDYLPNFVYHTEDPLCEPPAIALHYVSKLAREHVKVLLSGEGGDEAFGGYPNYRNQLYIERLKRVLGPLRGAASSAFDLVSRLPRTPAPLRHGRFLGLDLPEHYFSRTSTPFHYFHSAKGDLYTPDFHAQIPCNNARATFAALHDNVRHADTLSQMLYIDTKTWLPDDLLVKADKITMANSLELRVPLLDHRVLEFAAKLPASFKVHGREMKRVLKLAFRGIVPDEILFRKKAGLPVPYGRWLRTDLRDFVHDTLCSERALSRGYFQKDSIHRLASAPIPSPSGGSKELFSLLVLELWHQQFIDRPIIPRYTSPPIAASAS